MCTGGGGGEKGKYTLCDHMALGKKVAASRVKKPSYEPSWWKNT